MTPLTKHARELEKWETGELGRFWRVTDRKY